MALRNATRARGRGRATIDDRLKTLGTGCSAHYVGANGGQFSGQAFLPVAEGCGQGWRGRWRTPCSRRLVVELIG